MTYEDAGEILFFTGGFFLTRKQDSMKGEELRIDLKEEVFDAQRGVELFFEVEEEGEEEEEEEENNFIREGAEWTELCPGGNRKENFGGEEVRTSRGSFAGSRSCCRKNRPAFSGPELLLNNLQLVYGLAPDGRGPAGKRLR